jgi:integrase/recombinase XerD
MTINISSKVSRDNQKVWYYFEWGRSSGQRKSTGIFTWVKPESQVEKKHNKEALMILESKRSQLVPDGQSINTAYTPQHKIKTYFLDYYSDYIKNIFIWNR